MTTIAFSTPQIALQRKGRPASTGSAARRRAGGPDALVLLREDHRRIAALFKRFDKAKNAGDRAGRKALVDEICAVLTVHATIEDEILYPAARAALGDRGRELLDEAAVEHATARDLIAELESGSPGDELYDARVAVLGEYVRHHVKEEHDELFPACRKAKMDLKAVGARLLERKVQLQNGARPALPARRGSRRARAGRTA